MLLLQELSGQKLTYAQIMKKKQEKEAKEAAERAAKEAAEESQADTGGKGKRELTSGVFLLISVFLLPSSQA